MKRKKKIHLSHAMRIWLCFWVGIMVPVIVVLAIMAFSFEKRLGNHVEEQKKAELSYIDQNFESLMSKYDALLDQLMEAEVLYRFLSGESENDYYEMNERLYSLFGEERENCSVHVVSVREDLYASAGTMWEAYRYPQNTRSWGAFARDRRSEKRFIYVNDLHDEEMDRVLFSVVCPVWEGEEHLGYVILDIHASALERLIAGAESSYKAPVYFYSQAEFVVYSSSRQVERGRDKLPDYVSLRHHKDDSDIKVLYAVNGYTGLHWACEVPLSLARQAIRVILPTIILMMALVLLASALFANYMARHVTRPVRSSMAVIHRIEKGDFDARLEVTTDDEIGEMMEAINNMAGQLKELIQNVQDKQETLRVAQIENLKGQLKPHFLYNVFDLIRWKVYVSKPEEVDRIIVSLAKLLRASIDVGDGVYTIREEIGFLQNYAELNQALRPNLKIRFQISGELMEEKIPRLLLQPLVENAIKHGIGDRKEGGLVAVSGFWKEGSICLLVEDNGAGIEEEKLRQLKEEKGQKENIGIDNVRERVKLYGGPGSSMEISSTPGKGTLVRIVIRKGGEQEWKENG